MSLAGRNFNAKQALEKEVKDLYAKISPGNAAVAATATLDLTADIVLTSVAVGAARNTQTLTIQVLAAAANPTNTILAAFTGTAAAIVCTITPNDGTNNGSVPVNLTTAELRELITTGAVVGKTVTVTDASSLRALQTATGGGTQNLADGGEGDGVVATFSGGVTEVLPSFDSGHGFAEIVRNSAGDYSIVLQDAYASLKSAKARLLNSSAADLRFQLHSESVASKSLRLLSLAGTTPTNPPAASKILLKLELKNTAVGG